jgi:hypothetical protein
LKNILRKNLEIKKLIKKQPFPENIEKDTLVKDIVSKVR